LREQVESICFRTLEMGVYPKLVLTMHESYFDLCLIDNCQDQLLNAIQGQSMV